MILKTKFFLSFLLICSFILVGCSSSDDDSTATTDNSASSESVKNLGSELETSVSQLQGNDDQIQ